MVAKAEVIMVEIRVEENMAGMVGMVEMVEVVQMEVQTYTVQ